MGSGSSFNPQHNGAMNVNYRGCDPNTVTDKNHTDLKLSDDPYRYLRW